MLKWFLYIVFLLAYLPGILLAKTTNSQVSTTMVLRSNNLYTGHTDVNLADTVKTNKSAKTDLKVKEVPKPKKQPKPEKVDDADAKKIKPKRQRRPDGMDRPPEIPRRNDN